MDGRNQVPRGIVPRAFHAPVRGHNPAMRKVLLLPLLALMAACSDAELVGLHVNLRADGSGVLTTRTLVEPKDAGPAEGKAQGVAWEHRAVLHLSQGSFASVQGLQFGDIRFSGKTGDGDIPRLRVFVPRGPDAAWVKALAPDQETRRRMAKVYDPSGKTREIGENLLLEIQLPGPVISSGVLPTGRGVETAHERNKATLLVPAQTAVEKGEELVWDITWR